MSASTVERIGLVVVHGIGDPAPGEAFRDFTDSLIDAGLAGFGPVVDRRLLDVAECTPTRLAYFPALTRDGKALPDGQPVAAAEVFWGSASQLAPGRFGVILGTISLLLNVPVLLTGHGPVASGFATRLFRHVTWLSSMALAAVGFALNALLLGTFALYLAVARLAPDGADLAAAVPLYRWMDYGIPLISAGATTFVGWWWASKFWFPEAAWAFRFVGPVSILVSMVLALTTDPGNCDGATRCFATYTAATLVGLVLGAVVLLLVGVGLYVLSIMGRRVSRSMTTAVLGVSLQFGLWTILVPLSWRLLIKSLPQRNSTDWVPRLLDTTAKSDGVQWLIAGMVVGVLFGVIAWRDIRAKLQGAVPPRLILNPVLAFMLVLASVIGSAVIIGATLCGLKNVIPAAAAVCSTLSAPFVGTGIEWLADAASRLDVGSAVLVLVPFAIKPLRLGLDLVHDVISHLYYRCECARPAQRRRKGSPPKDPVGSRFVTVLEHMVRDVDPNRLVIVAHSQGSVIVLDALNRWNQLSETSLPNEISLVTLGSPLSHLYQHYFPIAYPEWSDPHWNQFMVRVRRWANFYRLSDYVGTVVAVPPQTPFTEVLIGQGSHTNYWRDPRLLRELKRWKIWSHA